MMLTTEQIYSAVWNLVRECYHPELYGFRKFGKIYLASDGYKAITVDHQAVGISQWMDAHRSNHGYPDVLDDAAMTEAVTKNPDMLPCKELMPAPDTSWHQDHNKVLKAKYSKTIFANNSKQIWDAMYDAKVNWYKGHVSKTHDSLAPVKIGSAQFSMEQCEWLMNIPEIANTHIGIYANAKETMYRVRIADPRVIIYLAGVV